MDADVLAFPAKTVDEVGGHLVACWLQLMVDSLEERRWGGSYIVVRADLSQVTRRKMRIVVSRLMF